MTEKQHTPFSPRVSVLIPTYNGERYIEETIRSVLTQTFTNFELLILDDCSTDNTVRIINNIEDSRIKLHINELNRGNGPTRDKLISLATGEYCAMLDHDDLCYPHRLQTQVSFLDAHPDIDLVSSALTVVDSHGNYTGKRLYHKIRTDEEIKVKSLYGCPVAQTSIMFRREHFIKAGCHYPAGQRAADDMEMYTTALPVLKFHNLVEPLVKYRLWQEQTSVTAHTYQLRDAAKALVTNYTNLLGEDNITEADKRVIFNFHYKKFIKDDIQDIRHFARKVLRTNSTKKMYDPNLLYRQFIKINRRLLKGLGYKPYIHPLFFIKQWLFMVSCARSCKK